MDKPFKYQWLDAIRSTSGPKKAITRWILINLGLHAKDDGSCCFPTYKTQAKETGCNERTINRNLEIAEAEGWIKKKGHRGKGQAWRNYEYILLVPDKVRAESPHVSKVRAESPRADEKVRTLTTEGEDFDDKKVRAESPINSSVKSSINLQEENQKNPPDDTGDFSGFQEKGNGELFGIPY